MTPLHIPGFEILGELGRGGMGVVYQARQVGLNRIVALKMILAGTHAGAEEIARFRAEAEAVAKLQHLGIVQIYEIGEHEGRPYFALEYVDGGSLSQKLAGVPLPARDAALLAEQLARAVEYAHEHGIIHRDLKPANVLLAVGQAFQPDSDRGSHSKSSPRSGVRLESLTYAPKITDFGLAKQVDADSGQTRSGAIVGTPSYMAPEQAAGLSKDIGPAADIYSLGAMLYEMLVGRPPFRAATMLQTLEQVRSQEPVAPSRLQPGLSRDLETICLKCLQKEPAKRYESAALLADDLARFLGGEPITARPVSRAERAWRWAKRKPVLAGLMSAVALLIVAVVVVPSVLAVRLNESRKLSDENAGKATKNQKTAEANEKKAETQRLEAEKQTRIAKEQKDRAETSEKLARRHLYAARMNLAEQAVAAGNLARALELLESVRPKFDEDDLRGFEWYHLWQVCLRAERFAVDRLGGNVLSVSFSADGQRVFAIARGGLTVCDTSTGERLATARAAEADVTLAVSPDGKSLVTGDGVIWDAVLLTPRTNVATRGTWINGAVFSADGQFVLSPHGSHLKLWDASTGEERGTIEHDGVTLDKVAFSPTGEFIAAGAADLTVRVWSWDGSHAKSHAKLAVASWGACVAFSPDGKKLATGGVTARLWDVASSSELKRLPGQTSEVYAAAFAPDGNTLAFGHKDRTVTIWDSASGTVQIVPHRGAVHAVAFSPDGTMLASGGEDQSLRLWNRNRPAEPSVLSHPQASSVAISSDRRTIVTGSLDHTVKLWDAASGKELATLSGHSAAVRAVAISPDGRWLATGGDDATIHLWDIESRQLTRSLLQGKQKRVWCLAFSPDGQTLASGGIKDADASDNPGELKLWDVATGEERLTFQDNCAWVGGLSFSPDGKQLATGHIAGSVYLWDVETGRRASVVQGMTQGHHWTWSVAFSPDGKLLATGDSEGTVRLRDPNTGRLLSTLKGQTAAIKSLVFFPDRRTLAAGGGDGTVKLWDIATGQERITLKGHAGEFGVAVASDGNMLVTAGKDGLVKLWHASIQPTALATKDELDADDPETPAAQLRAAYRDHPAGRYADAEKSYRAAIARFDQLAAAFPSRHEYRSELADAHQSLAATLQVGFNRVEEAEQELQLAQALYEKLVVEVPSETRFRHMLAYCHRNRMAVLILLGHADEAEKQFQKAREQYEQLLGEFPKIGEYQRRLVDLAAMQSARGKQDVAEQIYQRLLELSPDNPLSLNNLAWMMVSNPDAKLRDPARAIEIAKRAVELEAAGSRAGFYWNTLGVAHYRAGEWAAAINALERAMSLRSGGDSFDWFALAMAYHQQGDTVDARYWYGSAVEWMTTNKPKDEELLRFHAEARSLLGEAVDQPLANAEQSSADWWLEQGTHFATEEAWDKAAVRFSRAIELDGKNVRAWQGRGNAHAKLGRWDQALNDFTNATALAPNDAALWRARAEVQTARGQSPISDYTKAIAQEPADWRTLFARGEAYRQFGQHEKALSDFDAAFAVEPSDAALQLSRARSLTALQQWSKANVAWSVIIERDSANAAAWLERAVARQRLNQPEQAVADYDHVLALNPNDAASRLSRARLLHGLKQWEKAVADFDELLKLKPDDLTVISLRADTYFYPLKQYDKGIDDYSEFVRLQPNSPQPIGRRGRAYMVLCHWDKATADINRAVDLNSPVAETWYFYLLLRLHSGHTDDYAQLCASLANRFGSAKDAQTAASVARACSLAPSALADPTFAVQLAELALATDPKSALFQHNLGLAHHRAGQHAVAIRRFNESLAATPKSVEPLNWLGLALSHHRLGETDTAREWFTKADEWLDATNKQLAKSPAGTPPPHTFYWLEIQLLHREAKKLFP